MTWTCRRCGSQMFSVVGPSGAKATCSGCSQYLDCARCSNPKCGDTKCLKCYNKSFAGPPKPSGSIIPHDEDL